MWKTFREKLQKLSKAQKIHDNDADYWAVSPHSLASQLKAQQDALEAHQQAMASTLTTSSGLIYNGTMSGSYAGTNASPTYVNIGNQTYSSLPAPYSSEEWEGSDIQRAMGMGWILIAGHNEANSTPHLVAHPHGTKTQLSEEDLLADVVQQAIGGECVIAYKLLCVLTKNRSPYAQYEATTRELAEDYE